MKNKTLLKALIINGIFLILAIIFCDMKYEITDDFVMQSIIEGAYGNDYDTHLLYSNRLLGYGLKCLYLIFPQVGWYFVMQITLCFFGLTAISYIVFDACENGGKVKKNIGLLAVLLFVMFFSDDLYLLVQFTKTAAVACFSGALLVVYIYNKNTNIRKKLVGIICGIVLCLLGSMVRNRVIYIALVFMGVAFVLDIISGIKKNGGITRQLVKKYIIEIVLALTIYGCAVGLAKFNTFLWSDNEMYRDFLRWNSLRASITDVDGADEEVIRQRLLEKGYTLSDTYMIQSWEFIDQGYFNEETINDIAKIKREACEDSVLSIKGVLKTIKSRKYHRYTVMWGTFAISIMILLIYRKKWWYVISVFGAVGVLIIYCAYTLRLIYRVEYGFFYCAAGALMYLIANCLNDTKTIEGENILKPVRFAIIILVIAKIPLYIPDTSYKTMTDAEYTAYVEDVMRESWGFNARKYKVNMFQRKMYADLMELMENDSEHYYLCDFSTTIQTIYYSYKPWEPLPKGYYIDNYSYIGGVATYFPGCYYVWDQNGIDYINPYQSITNENIRVVDNYFYLSKYYYCMEKYNPQIQMIFIGEKNGMKIWEFR